ncbi:MAG: hypothetical protein OXC19_07025 [Bryobacterales bacterium]|nr:hypothetical protein [Bryobacterales bacterium]
MAELGVCGICRYWERDDLPGATHGECRRYPPTIIGEFGSRTGLWPETPEDAGCGEFKLEQQ